MLPPAKDALDLSGDRTRVGSRAADPPVDREPRRIVGVLEQGVLQAADLLEALAGQQDQRLRSAFPPERLFLPRPSHEGRLEVDDLVGARHRLPLLATMNSATRHAFAMIVSVGLAPVAVGNGLPSTMKRLSTS